MQLIVQIVLARLLSPKDFGTIAIVLVFINIAQVFTDSGLNTALIQKKDADDLDYSSVFYSSLAVASILFLIIYISSPNIAKYYGDLELTKLLRVLSFTLFPGAINSIQTAYISRNMLFKKLFYSSLGSLGVSAIAGILAAYLGLGVWALVIQNLANQISIGIIMWFTVCWRPRLKFSLKRLKKLLSFGWKLLASSLLNTFYQEVRTLVIGRIYSASSLGYYDRGQQIPKILVTNLDGSIQSVMLPTISSMQDNRSFVKSVVRRSIRISSFLVLPLMTGLAAVAEPAVIVILGEKWLPAVPFLQIFCVSSALQPIHSANLQAINAMGRSDIYLKLEIIKKSIGMLILLISIPFGIYAIAFGGILSSVISVFVNTYPNKKLFGYGKREQLADISPAVALSLAMGLIVFLIGYCNLAVLPKLFVQILSGLIIYIGLAKIFKMESLTYIRIVIIDAIESRKSSKN